MTNEITSAEHALRALLDQWAAGIAERRPADVAALFTEDALFQGFDPTPGFGRAYVTRYYDEQPVGLTAAYELLSTRELGPDALVAYARVLFGRPDGDATVYLTVIAQRGQDGWALSHYHVSRTQPA
jgi:uncharacterized protein (TIGR02246 family)